MGPCRPVCIKGARPAEGGEGRRGGTGQESEGMRLCGQTIKSAEERAHGRREAPRKNYNKLGKRAPAHHAMASVSWSAVSSRPATYRRHKIQ